MQYEKFKGYFGTWAEKFKSFIEGEEFDNIFKKLKQDGKEGRIICPASTNLFRAFELCKYENLKVVLLGMEPYSNYNSQTKTFVADGLTFSCSITDRPQPSLTKIYEAIEDDVYNGLDLHHTKTNDLSYLAQQGVLLLNASLTVEMGKIGSHKDLWHPFIKFLIEEIINPYNTGIVFLLMGKQAQEFAPYILPFNHYVLETEHPSYANRQERKMLHKEVFSQTNRILKENNNYKINWLLENAPF